MEKNKCKLCDYEWESRVDKPAQCPRCKRYDWNKDNNLSSRKIKVKI